MGGPILSMVTLLCLHSCYLLVVGIGIQSAGGEILGTLTTDKRVKVAASEAWKVYGTLRLSKLIMVKAQGFITQIDVVEGDGGAGTILEVFFTPGAYGGIKSFKEKFMVVDDEKRVKVTEVVEGGFLNLGFSLYRMRLEMIEEDEESCITRATIEFRLKQEAAANAYYATILPLIQVMYITNDFLERNKTNN